MVTGKGGGKGKDVSKGKDKGKDFSKGKDQGKSSKQKNVQAKPDWPPSFLPAKKPKIVTANFSWKCEVNQAYSKQYKTEGGSSLTRESFTYTTLPLEDGTFMSTIHSDSFSGEYATEEAYETQKEAEEAVAMAALITEFPAAYAAVPAAMKQKGSRAAEGTANAIKTEQPAKAVKRKAPSGDGATGPTGNYLQPKGTEPTDPKSRLNTGLTILKGVPLTKADTSYTSEEGDGSYVATLTVHCFEGQTHSFRGLAAGNRKEAEQYAAEATLSAFQSQIDAKMPEHEALKASREAARQIKKRAGKGTRK